MSLAIYMLRESNCGSGQFAALTELAKQAATSSRFNAAISILSCKFLSLFSSFRLRPNWPSLHLWAAGLSRQVKDEINKSRMKHKDKRNLDVLFQLVFLFSPITSLYTILRASCVYLSSWNETKEETYKKEAGNTGNTQRNERMAKTMKLRAWGRVAMTVSVASQSLSLPSSSRSNSGSSFFSSFSSFSFLSSESDSSSYSFLLAQIILFSAIASFLFLKWRSHQKQSWHFLLQLLLQFNLRNWWKRHIQSWKYCFLLFLRLALPY